MTAINFVSNTYSGEVLEDLLVNAVTGNETYDEGLVHIKSGIQYKYVLPKLSLSNIIQANEPTPITPTGTYSIDERYLEPKDFMVYVEFNPRDYEKYWKHTQPTGNLIFRELDATTQSKMLSELMKKKNQYLGQALWMSKLSADNVNLPAGITTNLGTGQDVYWDGFLFRVLKATDDAVAGETPVLAGNTTLDTGAKVAAALDAMWTQCPKAIRKDSALVFLMDYSTWDLYDRYLTDKDFKYKDDRDINDYRFKGKRIIPLNGFPEETIIMGAFDKTIDSNLWVGVDYANDTEALKVDRLQANSEIHFFQMRMKVDTNIVRPSEIVYWTQFVIGA